jgi:hypothetical protein
VDGVLEPRPKSFDLLALIERHLPALRYDWRTRLGLPLTSIFDGTMSWMEAWGYAEEILKDQSSHLFASVAGWLYPPSEAEINTVWLLEGWANAQRRKGTVPVILQRPWQQRMAESGVALVDADSPERMEAFERLKVLGPETPEPSDPPE